MNQVLRAYKYRIYPTKKQEIYLSQVFGSVRFVWNQLVAAFNSYSKTGPNPIVNEKRLKDMPEFSFLKDSISYALQQKRMDFDEFKKQFFNKKRKKKLGRPKFKKKHDRKDSFRIPGQALGYSTCCDFDDGAIKIPKMGWIKCVFDRKFTGQLKSVTVSRNKGGQYFVSILVQEEVEPKRNTGCIVGIDLGLKDLITTTDGVKIPRPKFFVENQHELKKQQRHLSRKKKGSRRYEKQRLKVARLHLKIANQRRWFLHNLSTWIVSNYDVICMEDLSVQEMAKRFGKSVMEAGMGVLISQIKYKSTWYGKTFHQVSRWFASSKICNTCGQKNTGLTLGDREWTCPSCGQIHDRDLNAANNILDRGLIDLYNFTSDELADYRRRGVVHGQVNKSPVGGFINETSSSDSGFIGVTANA